MSTTLVTFFEKPGCATNRRQKALLEQAGFVLKVKNLLSHRWDAAELRSYFDGLPISQWFNQAAPSLKNGDLDPGRMSAEQALQLMMDQPILIRRPLLECRGQRMAGFDAARLQQKLAIVIGPVTDDDDLQSCSKPETHRPCPAPSHVYQDELR